KTACIGDPSGPTLLVVFPTVVLADEALIVAARHVRQQTVPMGAHIDEGAILAIEIAQDNWLPEQLRGQKVTILGQISLAGKQMPARKEQLLKFKLVLLRRKILLWRQQMLKAVLIDEHGCPNLLESVRNREWIDTTKVVPGNSTLSRLVKGTAVFLDKL